MAILESLDHTTDTAISKSEEFIRNTEKYYELKLFQMLSSSLSLLLKFSLIGALSLIALILLSMALANYIGEYFGSVIIGYGVTALVFIGLALLVFSFRHHIENKIIKLLSTAIFK